MVDNAANRLRLFRKNDLRKTQEQFATELGVSTGLIGSVEAGSRKVSLKLLRLLQEQYNLNPEWIENGTLPKIVRTPSFQPPPQDSYTIGKLPGTAASMGFTVDDQPFGLIRRYDVDASAGPGAFVEHEDIVDQVAFSGQWLRNHDLMPDKAGIITARGISMEPVIPDGAKMVVKFDITPPFQDGIYIFRRDGEIYVKRCSVLASDPINRPTRIMVIAPNLANQPDIVEITQPDTFVFLARVVATLTEW